MNPEKTIFVLKVSHRPKCLCMYMYVYGWISWGWEAHFRNYRHYVSQCPISTLEGLPNFPRQGMGWPGLRFIHLPSESPWVGIETRYQCVYVDVYMLIFKEINLCNFQLLFIFKELYTRADLDIKIDVWQEL